MAHLIRFAALLVTVALFAAVASAQSWTGRGRLSGAVQDPDGGPVEGASVRLTLDGAGPDEVLTNQKGRWARAGLGSGAWEVLVSKPGYVPTAHTAQVQEYGGPSDRVFLNTTLEPAAPSADDASALDESGAAQAAREQLERGNRLLAAADYEGAIQVFFEALASVPDNAKASILVAIAQAQVQLERDEEALATLERVLDLAPANVKALRLMSRRLTALGRREEAQAYLDRMPEDQRIDPEILLREGLAAYNRDDFEGAIEKFDAAIEVSPDRAEAYYFRGRANMAAGKNAAAAADFRRLLELAPEGERAEEARQFAEYLESL